MDVQEAKAVLRGPMVSVATPFNADYTLDLGALRDNIRFMVDGGLNTGRGVLLVAAAGGEFPMLSMEERKQVIKASVEAARGQAPVACSIQFNGTREVIELARYAYDVGASLGQLSAPSYYPPPDEDIHQLFLDVSTAAKLPIMIYNNWWNTLNMNLGMVERLAELRTVVALKWSAPSSGQFTEGLYRMAGRLAIIDNENQIVWSHMLGAVGFITHVSNFWPAYPGELADLLERRCYDEVIDKLAFFQWPWGEWVNKAGEETEGEGPFIKAAMEEVGLRVGPPRPPARPLSAALRQELRELLNRVGVPRVGG
jgi:4-hydroxy-tetrahydrodipicolinate synthase